MLVLNNGEGVAGSTFLLAGAVGLVDVGYYASQQAGIHVVATRKNC